MLDCSYLSHIESNSSYSSENNSQEWPSFLQSFLSIKSIMPIDQSNDLELEESSNYNNSLSNNNSQIQDNKKYKSNDSYKTNISKKKKPGRKKNLGVKTERLEHDKFAKDNIKRKIQVHYLKFLRNFINHIIKEIIPDIKNIQFYPLNYNFAKDIRKKAFDSLKNTKIGDIFKNNVSPKYKNYETLNIDVYNKVTKKNDDIKKILDKLYLDYFIVYYIKKKEINLSKYDGPDKNIILSDKIGFYTDLINENDINSEYHKKVEKCIKKDFIDKPLFIVL